MMTENALNPWQLPQKRIELKAYTPLYQLDDQEMATLDEFLNGPQVEMVYELNDETDYAVHFKDGQQTAVARVSDTVSINGVRWHLQPGKNIIPKAVYEFLMQCPEQRRRLSAPVANRSTNLGQFYSRYGSRS